jgi:hypothetical protein
VVTMQILPKWARDGKGVRFFWGFAVESSLQPRESRVFCRQNDGDGFRVRPPGGGRKEEVRWKWREGVGKGVVAP